MNNLIGLYTAGKIRPTIDSVWSFDDVSVKTEVLCMRVYACVCVCMCVYTCVSTNVIDVIKLIITCQQIVIVYTSYASYTC